MQPGTLSAKLRAIVDALPEGAAVTLPAATLKGWLSDDTPEVRPRVELPSSAGTWKDRLWMVPADTRLGVTELAEALDRSPDWVYRATSSKVANMRGRDPLPCRKLDGSLVFSAGAVRDWVARSEIVVIPEPRKLRKAS